MLRSPFFAPLVAASLGLTASIASQAPTDKDRVLHFLNRTTFGPSDAKVDQLLNGPSLQLDTRLLTELDDQMSSSLVDDSVFVTNLGTLQLATAGQGSAGTLKDLQKSILLRATFSKRQLRELMTVFWERHFNTAAFVVQAGLPQVAANAEAYTVHFEREENDFFRAGAFADFRDLLDYSAKHLPMLIYLNGGSNVAGSINENFARELLELHTMGPTTLSTGVTNYAQSDVVAVAQLLTGWQIVFDLGSQTYSVIADDNKHVTFTGSVTLFQASGAPVTIVPAMTGARLQADTNALLDVLARRPATRDFVIRKLIAYFYGDADAVQTSGTVQAIIDQAKVAWGTRGNIKAVLDVILRDPSFLDASKRWSRIRTPVEQVAWLPRMAGAAVFLTTGPTPTTVPNALELPWFATVQSAEALFQFPSPDGYPVASDEQLGSQSYLDRVAFGKVVYDEFRTLIKFLLNHDYVPALTAFKTDLLAVSPSNYKDSGAVATYLLDRCFGSASTTTERDLVIQILDHTHTGAFSPLSAVPSDGVWSFRVLSAMALISGLPRASTK